MKIPAIDIETIETWVKLIGSTPTRINDNEQEWHIEFDYPSGSQHRTHIIQPLKKDYQITIAAGLRISEEHLKQFDELPGDEQKEFILELSGKLNRPEVDFKMDGMDDRYSCPKAITITKTRFGDGLTLDSFNQSVGQVFKAKLQGIYFFNLNLEDMNQGGGGFKFKPVLN